MITVIVQDQYYIYDIYHIVKAFFPGELLEQSCDETYSELALVRCQDSELLITQAEIAGIETPKERKYYVTRKVYEWLCAHTGRVLAWGVLTGIRPTKLAMKRLESHGEKAALSYMMDYYRLTPEKARLAVDIAKTEQKLLAGINYENGYSLYVGIPFCPTTCAYCSFTSYPIEVFRNRVDAYLDALIKELMAFARMMKGRKPDTIYIGGGTPTTLEPPQLDRLLSCITERFAGEGLLEFSVEAGRPDSITPEKLRVLRQYPVTRISINPQTMQQKTLDVIGRKHTVEDIIRVYGEARAAGFDNINMDLIAGLPGETPDEMEDTLRQIQNLNPDSLTIHSLAIKRAAKMNREEYFEAHIKERSRDMAQMISLGQEYAELMQMKPYYLYRQKNIAGNFENVGYGKVDKAGIYNILIMEEKQTILAAGAGATTKLVSLRDRSIQRMENVKDIQQYMTRLDEMIQRKEDVLWQ